MPEEMSTLIASRDIMGRTLLERIHCLITNTFHGHPEFLTDNMPSIFLSLLCSVEFL